MVYLLFRVFQLFVSTLGTEKLHSIGYAWLLWRWTSYLAAHYYIGYNRQQHFKWVKIVEIQYMQSWNCFYFYYLNYQGCRDGGKINESKSDLSKISKTDSDLSKISDSNSLTYHEKVWLSRILQQLAIDGNRGSPHSKNYMFQWNVSKEIIFIISTGTN